MKTCVAIILLCLVQAPMARPTGAYLGELTWPQAEEQFNSSALVILPFAAGAKEHGRLYIYIYP